MGPASRILAWEISHPRASESVTQAWDPLLPTETGDDSTSTRGLPLPLPLPRPALATAFAVTLVCLFVTWSSPKVLGDPSTQAPRLHPLLFSHSFQASSGLIRAVGPHHARSSARSSS